MAQVWLKGLGGSSRWRQGEVRWQWHFIFAVTFFSRYLTGGLAIASDTRLLRTLTRSSPSRCRVGTASKLYGLEGHILCAEAVKEAGSGLIV